MDILEINYQPAMTNIKTVSFVLLVIVVASFIRQLPHPDQDEAKSLQLEDVCQLYHEISHHELIDSHYYFNKILKRLNRHYQCLRPLLYNPSMHTLLNVSRSQQLKSEAYKILINEQGIQIFYSDYSGYVYALERLFRIIKKGKNQGLIPFTTIQQSPKFSHRGIMIDTARHFLPVPTIQRLIQAMPMSKLNILHWHFIDDQSFSIKLNSHPELAEYGSYGSKQVYDIDTIRGLIALADKNGVKIVPQINTPAHMRSWFLSPNWQSQNITISCNIINQTGKYCGQTDPSKTLGLQLVKEVVAEVDNLFRNSPYIHLGGDSISFECWDKRPSIKNNFMKIHYIKTYQGLVNYWNFEIKQDLPSSRKIIYWSDSNHSVQATEKDIIQFKGNSSNLLEMMRKTQSQFILSPFDLFDLTSGFGNLWMNETNNNYTSWRAIYENYTQLLNKVSDESRVLGGELLVWGTIANRYNFENIVWMRAALFGQRLWSNEVLPIHELIPSMVMLQHALEEMGLEVSPLTSEYCEHKPEICWPYLQTENMVIAEVL